MSIDASKKPLSLFKVWYYMPVRMSEIKATLVMSPLRTHQF